MKYFLKSYEYSYQWSLLRSICANIRKPGGIKEGYNFSDFFHYFLFSHKLIKYFMKVVGNSFVIMHPDMQSRKPGGIKEGDNFSDFFHYFSFSHKLIKYFMKVVGNSFVIMHPDMQSRPQLPITGCFARTEVHLFSFRG